LINEFHTITNSDDILNVKVTYMGTCVFPFILIVILIDISALYEIKLGVTSLFVDSSFLVLATLNLCFFLYVLSI